MVEKEVNDYDDGSFSLNPWVDASAGELKVPKCLYSPVAKYFGTCLKIQILCNRQEQIELYK
jgi:hypothetical protein